MKLLTDRMLEAIIHMVGQVEAGGTDEVQGIVDADEQERMYNAMLDAREWAHQEREKRRSIAATKAKKLSNPH